MKTLIVYYSRTGTTKKVGLELAQRLGADTEELIDTKKRDGVMGYVVSGRDAIKQNMTILEKLKNVTAEYDLIIVGTPVWVGTLSPAIRTYLEAEKSNIKKIAFFVTQGAKPPSQENIFQKMEMLLDKKSLSNLQLSTKQVVAREFEDEITQFVKKLEN